MNLLEQGLEAFVFGEPCADLGEQLLGDINGASLAGFLEGEMLTDVAGPAVVAAAGGASTAVGISAKGGSEDRGRGGQLLEAVLQHAKDEGGMIGDANGRDLRKRVAR